jgi:hypothetical protein
MGYHWGWEATDGAEEDSLKVADCLGEVALAALMVVVHWECTVGTQVVHLLGPLAEQAGSSSGSSCRTGLVGFWSLGFITWAMKILLCPFLLA